MEALFLRVLTLSLTASAVLLPLLAMAPWLRRRYAGRAFYVLWLLLALRLLLPFQLPLPGAAVTVRLPPAEALLPSAAARPPAEAADAPPSAPAGEPLAAETEAGTARSWTELGARLWLGGLAVLLMGQGISCALARRRLLRGAAPGPEEERALLTALAAQLRVGRTPPLLHTPDVASPMVLGLVRPVLLLPAEPLPPEALEAALRHELTHLRRHDVAYQALMGLAGAVHWFNPLVWWMGREARCSLELCCDDAVVRGRDEDFRRRYGALLLRTAAGGETPLSTRLGGGRGQLKERLDNLFRRKRSGGPLVCAALACALLATSLVACERAALPPQEPRDGQTEALERLDALEDSVAVSEDGALSFTIPAGVSVEEGWRLQISGRAETEELGGVSLHYLEGADWRAGETYTLDITAEQWADITELNMEVYPPDQEEPDFDTDVVQGYGLDLLALYRAAGGAAGSALVYTSDAWGLTLTLPESWAEYGAFQEEEDGSVLFYCAALGPETGGIAQVSFQDEPAEETTGRVTLLGAEDGRYVYSYGYQAPLPDLQQAPEAVREQYDTLYDAFRDGLILTFTDTTGGRSSHSVWRRARQPMCQPMRAAGEAVI